MSITFGLSPKFVVYTQRRTTLLNFSQNFHKICVHLYAVLALRKLWAMGRLAKGLSSIRDFT